MLQVYRKSLVCLSLAVSHGLKLITNYKKILMKCLMSFDSIGWQCDDICSNYLLNISDGFEKQKMCLNLRGKTMGKSTQHQVRIRCLCRYGKNFNFYCEKSTPDFRCLQKRHSQLNWSKHEQLTKYLIKLFSLIISQQY